MWLWKPCTGRAIVLFRKSADQQPRRFSEVLFTSLMVAGLCFSTVLVLTLRQTEVVMEEISLHHWLDAEVRRYEADWQSQGEDANLPNPLEFDVWRDDDTRPDWLAVYEQPGFYEHLLGAEDKHFLVASHPSGSGLIYLVFKDDADDYLDAYEGRLHAYGLLLALSGVLTLLVLSWLLTRRLSHPLQAVERKVRNLAPSGATIRADAPYAELRTIESTMADVQHEVAHYLRREQEFSHFVSHEMRTPLTVVQGSAEVLNRIVGEQASGQRAVARIQSACREMTILIETFLLLGRGDAIEDRLETVDAGQLLVEIIDASRARRGERNMPEVEINTPGGVGQAGLLVRAPEYFLRVLFENLVRNAVTHSQGGIDISLSEHGLTMSNAVSAHSSQTRGYGYGLVICQRICERMGWQLVVDGDSARYRVRLDFHR